MPALDGEHGLDRVATGARCSASLLSAANPKNLALTVAASASIAQAGLETGERLLADAVFVAIGSITVVGAVIFALVAPRAPPRPPRTRSEGSWPTTTPRS